MSHFHIVPCVYRHLANLNDILVHNECGRAATTENAEINGNGGNTTGQFMESKEKQLRRKNSQHARIQLMYDKGIY